MKSLFFLSLVLVAVEPEILSQNLVCQKEDGTACSDNAAEFVNFELKEEGVIKYEENTNNIDVGEFIEQDNQIKQPSVINPNGILEDDYLIEIENIFDNDVMSEGSEVKQPLFINTADSDSLQGHEVNQRPEESEKESTRRYQTNHVNNDINVILQELYETVSRLIDGLINRFWRWFNSHNPQHDRKEEQFFRALTVVSVVYLLAKLIGF